jgi:hypothetical protein
MPLPLFLNFSYCPILSNLASLIGLHLFSAAIHFGYHLFLVGFHFFLNFQQALYYLFYFRSVAV